jgi:XTP/dITP diphosphohydrolase
VSARLCSRNEHKAEELRRALPGWTIELLDAREFPPEEADSYYENALAKARFGRTLGERDRWMLGEDSGIEVEALDGAPGVHSKRWAGGEDEADKVLRTLGAAGDRRARMITELVALSPAGEELRGTGVLEGAIAEERRGTTGFGYDPVFVPAGETRTVAELGEEWKSRNSHRARAAHALLEAIAGRAAAR